MPVGFCTRHELNITRNYTRSGLTVRIHGHRFDSGHLHQKQKNSPMGGGQKFNPIAFLSSKHRPTLGLRERNNAACHPPAFCRGHTPLLCENIDKTASASAFYLYLVD